MEDESWLYRLRTDGGVVFRHSGCWIVLGMRGQKDRNGLLIGGCWLSSIWMKSLGMTREVFSVLYWGPFYYIGS